MSVVALVSKLCGGPLSDCCPELTITERGVVLSEHGQSVTLTDAQLQAVADRVAHARAAVSMAEWLDEDDSPPTPERTP